MSYRQDVDDAISTAASEVGKSQRFKDLKSNRTNRKLPATSKAKWYKNPKPLDRVVNQARSWGNQYYSDPASSGGIKGALAKA